jgi:3-hydroxyacyl-[acyl-carrier-protein] dehydratase
LIDRILRIEEGEGNTRVGAKAVAIKNVTVNEPFFGGHFPDNPIMPGVLLVEAMGQAGALACVTEKDFEKEFKVMIAKINNARFRRPVIPGDQVIIESQITKDRGKMFVVSCKATVDGVVVADTELLAQVLIGPQ